MVPQGGTELLMSNLFCHLGSWPQSINLIVSTCDATLLDDQKKNLVWQHLDIDQAAAQGAHDPIFQQRVHVWVFVSEWQRTQWLNHFHIDPQKTCVIRNAIPHSKWCTKPPTTSGLELIYTSTPWRGLSVLLDALDLISITNWRLTVYSSMIIYGKQFHDTTHHQHQALFDRCRQHDQIKYVGYGTNQAVRAALKRSHLFTYPCTFRETSCLAALEAAQAGCRVVTTSLGALEESLGAHARFVPMSHVRTQLVQTYAEALAQEMLSYDPCNPSWQKQAEHFDNTYGWHHRLSEWQQLIQHLLDE